MGKLSDIIKADSNALLIISAADLKEFAEELMQEARTEAERQLDEQRKDRYLSAKEAAKLLSVDTSTLWRWRNNGYINSVMVGGQTKYRLSDINAFIKSKEG